MKYQDSGVTFGKVTKPQSSMGAMIMKTEGGYNVSAVNSMKPDYVMTEEEKGDNVINAIDIDWCAADLNGTTINSTGELLSKVIEHDKKLSGAEDTSVQLPANIIAYYSEEKLVESSLDSISDKKIFSTSVSSFAINDNSLTNNFNIDRANTEMYSIVAWPKTFGTFAIPSEYRNSIYTTEYNKEVYYAIVSNNTNRAFIPIVVKR